MTHPTVDPSPATAVRGPWLPPRWFIRLAWVVHRAIYRLTGGRRGLRLPTPGRFGMLRLTTVGRRSGRERTVILGYYEDGPNLVSMAMNGWGAAEPAWWLNLKAHPHAVIELAGGVRREVLGKAAVGEERERLWALMRQIWPAYDRYQTRTDREIPVVVLTPR